jgi:hypothetical protein
MRIKNVYRETVRGLPNLVGDSAPSAEALGETLVPMFCVFCGTPCGVGKPGEEKACSDLHRDIADLFTKSILRR